MNVALSKNSVSLFIAGLLVGLLIATVGFSLLVRQQNLAQGSGGNTTVLKLGHSLDQNHPVHKAMMHMVEVLKEKSGGTVELQVFPNGQLGSETESLEQLQRGALAMTKTSTAPMESFIPEMAVFGIPYVFRDSDHFWKVINGEIGKRLLEAGIGVGLRGLCYYDAGSRNFYTIDQPILKPSDLKGLKIRVQKSKTSMDMVEALGGSPTPIPYGELYTALQQKMVDGAENNPPSFYNSRHFEVCKHLSMDEHTRVPDMLIVSEKVWQRLSPQVRQWVQEAADESAEFERNLWGEEVQRVLKAAEEAGVTVHYPDKTLFVELVAPIHKTYAGTAVGNLLERIGKE